MNFIEKFKSILPKDINFEELKDTVAADIWKSDPETAAIIFLKRNNLFDEESYILKNKDVKEIKPIEHFVKYGINENRRFAELNQIINRRKVKICNPKVSVIVPIYNNYEYLVECIESIKNQKLKNIEILLINDGSTDERVLPLIKDISKNDKRCVVINKTNTGYGHTVNIGIDKATGEYIGVVESDDFIKKDMYFELYKIAKENNCQMVKSDFDRFIIEDGKYKLTHNKLTDNEDYYDKIINTSEDLNTFNFVMNTWSGIYKKEFLLKNKIKHNETPGAAFQDNGFYFQTFMYCTRAFFTKKSFYMNRRDNINSSVYSKDRVFAFTKEYDFIDNIINKNQKNKRFFPISLLKRFQNYRFNCKRIDKERLNEFVSYIRNEFLTLLNCNKLNLSYFSLNNLNDIILLLNNEKAFIKKICK